MKVLITGGCGFIGSHLVEHYLAKGDTVNVVDDLSTGSMQNIVDFIHHPAFHYEIADIITWPNLLKVVMQTNLIFHMAAVVGIYRVLSEPIKVISTNMAGCERILRAVKATEGNPSIIIASTSEVYGHSEKETLKETDNLIVESTADPRWSYANSKIADETLGMAYYQAANIPVIIVRLFNTIGPRQSGRYGMVVPRFIQQSCSGNPITVYGDGKQTRSFCDVRDIVAALDNLAMNPAAYGHIVNVGNDREITINDLAHLIRERAHSESDIQYVPYKDAYQCDFKDIMRRRPNLHKFFELTHYNFKWPLEKTIDELIELYLKMKK